MARVEKLNKRKAAISAMVESIIKGNSASAEEHLHNYLQTLSKELIIGESDEEMEANSKKSDEDDKDAKVDVDDDDDAKVDDDDEDEAKAKSKVDDDDDDADDETTD